MRRAQGCGCLLGVVKFYVTDSQYAVVAAAWIIAIGSIVTSGTRLRAIARQLKAR